MKVVGLLISQPTKQPHEGCRLFDKAKQPNNHMEVVVILISHPKPFTFLRIPNNSFGLKIATSGWVVQSLNVGVSSRPKVYLEVRRPEMSSFGSFYQDKVCRLKKRSSEKNSPARSLRDRIITHCSVCSCRNWIPHAWKAKDGRAYVKSLTKPRVQKIKRTESGKSAKG